MFNVRFGSILPDNQIITSLKPPLSPPKRRAIARKTGKKSPPHQTGGFWRG
jgi:hypothetical protein